MHIVSLTAENIKRLVAVSITPTGNMVEITGKNGQGKTSVLDSIWWALAGAEHIQGKPIRAGQDKAQVMLDLGDIVVTRKFSAKDDGGYTTSLTVTNKEGLKYGSPQAVLDKLLDSLAFDPLEFARAEPSKQLAMLRKFVPGVDFAEIDRQNKADYDLRTVKNREAKQSESAAAVVQIPTVTDDKQKDVAALEQELQAAVDANGTIEARKVRRQAVTDQVTANFVLIERAGEDVDSFVQQAAAKRAEAEKLDQQAERRNAERVALKATTDELQKKINEAGALPVVTDLTELRAKVAAAREHNLTLTRRTDKIAERDRYIAQAKASQADADALTKARDERTAARDKAIAEAEIPVAGITFGDAEVMLNGVPFEQASDAEQLRASVAIAMAGNPQLRVVRIRDGSLLDSDSMAIVAEMAATRDMQVWIETVDQRGRVGVVIEDGMVKS